MGRKKESGNVEQAGQQTVPEGGTAVPAQPVVPAEEQPDPVPGDQGEQAVEGAGEHPPADPVASVEEPALDVGAATADAASDEDDSLTFKAPLDVAELARGVGAAARFFTNSGLAVDGDDMFDRDEAAIMAAFVRDHPDAPVPAMYNHLVLTRRYPPTIPNREDEFVLALFHATCLAAWRFEADRAAEVAQPAPAGAWPGEQAFQIQAGAFDASGFTAR